MADWSEEIAACAYGHSHQESVRSHLSVRSEFRGDWGHALLQARSIAYILLPRITVLNTILRIVKEAEVGNHPMATAQMPPTFHITWRSHYTVRRGFPGGIQTRI